MFNVELIIRWWGNDFIYEGKRFGVRKLVSFGVNQELGIEWGLILLSNIYVVKF